jgi:hypothetical protein
MLKRRVRQHLLASLLDTVRPISATDLKKSDAISVG